LTRALADFVKLVELFDAYGVPFVSVTQIPGNPVASWRFAKGGPARATVAKYDPCRVEWSFALDPLI
jgi:hypothetical protein